MPQSLSTKLLKALQPFIQKAAAVPQNINQIFLYKDKIIAFLLQQSDFCNDLYVSYSDQIKEFSTIIDKQNYQDLAICSRAFLIDENEKHISAKISSLKSSKICLKPFNLFGGLGVGIFDQNDHQAIALHLKKVAKLYQKYYVEYPIIIAQKAIAHPDFGDVRIFFSYGKVHWRVSKTQSKPNSQH